MGRWDKDEDPNDENNLLEQVYLLFMSVKHLQKAVEEHQKILENMTELYYKMDREITKLKKQVDNASGSDIK